MMYKRLVASCSNYWSDLYPELMDHGSVLFMQKETGHFYALASHARRQNRLLCFSMSRRPDVPYEQRHFIRFARMLNGFQ